MHRVFQVLEVLEAYILDVYPSYLEVPFPLCLVVPLDFGQTRYSLLVIRDELGDSTELATLVETEEQIDRIVPIFFRVGVRLIKLQVTFLSARPDFVENRLEWDNTQVITLKMFCSLKLLMIRNFAPSGKM